MEFSGLNHQGQSFIRLINVKITTIVGILTFASRINFIFRCVEHEFFFYNLGAWPIINLTDRFSMRKSKNLLC